MKKTVVFYCHLLSGGGATGRQSVLVKLKERMMEFNGVHY